ncbi:MAG: hypothetical protein ACKOB2_08720 [Solirubrobacterales bacterium]
MTSIKSSDSWQAQWSAPAFLLLVLAVVLLSAWFYLLGEEFTFFRDEWDMLLYRLPTVDSLLASHGGQQVPIISAFFQGGSRVFGLDDYQYFRASTVLLPGLCSILLFFISFPRIGPWFALLSSFLLLALGASYEVALWPMVAITFAGAALAGLSALLLCTKGDVRYDVGAAGLLVVTVALSGFGLVFLVGVAAYLLSERNSPRLRLWIPVPALILYLAWHFFFQTVGSEPPPELIGYVEFPLAMVNSGIHGVTGMPLGVDLVLGLMFLVAVFSVLSKGARANPLLVSSLLMLVAFLALSTQARGGFSDPGAIRYIFPTVLLLLLVLVALQPESTRGRYLLGGSLIVLCLISIPRGIAEYSRGADNLREQARVLKAELAAAEVGGRESIAPETPLASTIYSFPTSYHFFDAVDRYSSSPALTLSELENSSESQREAADVLLSRAQGVIRRQPRDRFLAFLAKPDTSCSRLFPPTREVTPLEPGAQLWVSSSTSGNSLSLRRFADGFSSDRVPIPRGAIRVSSKVDRAPGVPWEMLVDANRGEVGICRIAERQ